LSGDAAVRTAADQDWDPSVRSLLAFPMVLETMASHPRWTQDLGDAFLAQREEVMDTIQALRLRAYQAGTLRSNEAVRVVETLNGIVIEQAVPTTVYVPHYDPRVAYGGWWWPSRPPIYWPRWSGYVDPYPRHVHWGPGIHVSSGVFFGAFVWPRREVRVVHVHPHFHPHRHTVHGRPVAREFGPGVWRHDDWRRRDHRDWRRDDDRREVRRRDDDDRRRWEELRRVESAPREAVMAPPAAPIGNRQSAPAEGRRRGIDYDGGSDIAERREAREAHRRDQREQSRSQRRDREDGNARMAREPARGVEQRAAPPAEARRSERQFQPQEAPRERRAPRRHDGAR
jgi:hypothetical protein